MATTYQIVDFADMQRRVRNELKVDPNDQSNINRIQEIINEVYIQEIVPFKRWLWTSGSVDAQVTAVVTSGTASVTPDSAAVTLSFAPSASVKGFFFAVDTFNEIYTIESHTAGQTSLALSQPFVGNLNSAVGYKIWTDNVALPNDCREVISVWHDFSDEPMEPVGLQQFRKRVGEAPRLEDRPSIFTTYDFFNPSDDAEVDSTRYRQLKIWPAISAFRTTLHIDYTKKISPLTADGDEPVLPLEDRIVIVYAALARAWRSIGRNPEEAATNDALYRQKLTHMAGRLETSNDKPKLSPDSDYLRRKRGGTGRLSNLGRPSLGGGGSSVNTPYLKNPTIDGAKVISAITVNNGVTIDGRDISADGLLLDSTATTVAALSTEVSALQTLPQGEIFVGNNSNIATASPVSGDASLNSSGALTVNTVGTSTAANIHSAEGLANAATNANTASTIVKRDGSGNFSAGTITANLTGNASGTAANVTGTVAIANGGTGQTTATTAFNALSPMTTSGDTIYGGTSGTGTRLAGNTTTTKKFKTQTGDGTNSAPPAWNTIAAADVPSLAASIITSGQLAAARGGTGQDLSAASGAISVASGTVSAGTLSVANGGTGQTTATTAFNALSPMTTLGDTVYGAASGAGTRLAGNTTTTKKFKIQTGDGTNSAAPTWGTIAAADVPSLAASIITSGQLATARGGTGQDLSASTGAISVSSGTVSAGTLSIANGGTGQTTATNAFNVLSPITTKGDLVAGTGTNAAGRLAVGGDGTVLTADSTQTAGVKWASALTNPMTTLGDIIYENASPAAVRLAGNTTSTINFLSQTGTGSVSAAPVWSAFIAPTKQTFLLTTYYTFTVTAANATVGATFTNNSKTFTVVYTIAAGTTLVCSGTGAPTGSGTLTKSGGTGDATIAFSAAVANGTYQLPSSPRAPLYIRVKIVGGGGGGGGGGASGGSAGGTGGNTTFGTSLLTANGGAGGNNGAVGDVGGAGGTASIGAGASGVPISGGSGGTGTGTNGTTAEFNSGGSGGSSALGGAGSGGFNTSGATAGATNSGSGGGAGGSGSLINAGGGAGGGSGGFVDALISSPSSTYVFNVGAGGTAGSAGTTAGAGGAGGSGLIEITEYYQ